MKRIIIELEDELYEALMIYKNSKYLTISGVVRQQLTKLLKKENVMNTNGNWKTNNKEI